jgi:hypothetical protein
MVEAKPLGRPIGSQRWLLSYERVAALAALANPPRHRFVRVDWYGLCSSGEAQREKNEL